MREAFGGPMPEEGEPAVKVVEDRGAQALMRISVSNFSTTENDVRRSAAAILVAHAHL